MSFNPPRTTPSFNTNRGKEDDYWQQKYTKDTPGPSTAASSYSYPHSRSAANGHVKTASTSAEQIKEKLGGLLGTSSSDDLPLYKDKPRFSSNRRRLFNHLHIRGRRRTWLIIVVAVLSLWWLISITISWLSVKESNWKSRRSMVREVFILCWEDYARYAWGKDVYSPMSRKGKFIVHKPGESDPVNAGVGWIIADALDTAILMNATNQVTQARKWIEASLDFHKLDGEVNTFETTIRVLGGLLSAHYLSTTFPHLAPQVQSVHGSKGEDLYIEKAVDLAERLLGAFESPSGLPYASINLNTSLGRESGEINGVSSLAEAGTVQLEFKYLAKVTGEPLYWTIPERAMQAIDAPKSRDGLVPMFIDPQTGNFQGWDIRVGARTDSYYEYLIKQYLQTGETIYKDMWEEALEGIKNHLVTWSRTGDFTVLADRPEGLGGPMKGQMDHLTCFLPGAIALSVTGGLSVTEAKKQMGSSWGAKQEEDLLLAEELLKTCWGMYVVTPTGLSPEIVYLKLDDPPRRWKFGDASWKQPRSVVDFENIKSSSYTQKDASWRSDFEIQDGDVHNLQRPETAESLYYMWRITGNPMYREWGWRMFQSFMEYSKVLDPRGKVRAYTSLESVMRIPPKHLRKAAGMGIAQNMATHQGVEFEHDSMEGFWLSETLKYLYLLFHNGNEDEYFDLSKVVISSEGHYFPRFDITGHSVFKTGWKRHDGPTRVPLSSGKVEDHS